MRPSEIFYERRDELRKIGKKYEDMGLVNLRVFGSVADGTDTEDSDIDFAVDVKNCLNIFIIGGLHDELEEAMGMKIDLVLANASMIIPIEEINKNPILV